MHVAITLIALVCSIIPLSAADWPQWLGPTRDSHVSANEKFLTKLPSELIPVWKIQVGGGFSSPIVASGKLIYFDENGEKEIVHLLDAKSGKEIWQTSIADRYADEWGSGPRSTPFIDGNRVYVQSCNGEFRCLNLADGKILWAASFENDFGVKFLGSKGGEGTAARRGNNGSGIAEGNAVIVPVGSTNGATLVCFDKLTGKVLWKSGNEEAAYSSLQVATLAGVKQVIAFTADSLMGVDRKDGKQLWRVPLKTGAKRHTGTPVIFGNNIVVNSQTIGLVCFEISKQGMQLNANEVWANKKLKINIATPVHAGGFLYSQGANKNFVCVDAKSGELKWDQPGFGKQNSSILVFGDRLLVLTDEGELVSLVANPEKYSELSRVQAIGKNWNYPAWSDGKAFLRDSRELACFDLQP